MKTIRTITIIALTMFVFSNFSYAQGLKFVKIKTSVDCEACKTKIEKAINSEEGVEEASLDLETNILSVKFESKKTNYDKLVTAVTNLGYSADDKKGSSSYTGCCSGNKTTVKKDCGSKYKSDCSKKCSGHQ